MRKLETCSSWSSASFKADIKYRQSWIQVWDNLAKLFFIWMKTSFSSVVTPSPPKQIMLQNTLWMFICFQHWKRGRGRLPFTNLSHGKRLVIFMYLNNFCPWLHGGNKVLWYQNVWFRSEQWISHWSDPIKIKITSDFVY